MIIRILKYTAFVGIFILLAGISAYLTLSLLIKSEDKVIVPDFIGQDVVYVLELLTEMGLNTKVQGSDYSAEIPKNHVIDQNPRPGAEIKKGRDVKIVISKGPEQILMPNLVGLTPPRARIIFEENDLCQGQLASVFDERNDKDTVIAQVPQSGTMVRRGQCVDLLVSLGPRQSAYKMPELTGLALEDALLTIEANNLSQGKIGVNWQQRQPRNVILEQNPMGGHRILARTNVALTINRREHMKAGDLARSAGIGRLLSYRIPPGFLKRRVRVAVQSGGYSGDIFDDFVKPGQDLWVIVPVEQETMVLVYEDEILALTEVYN